MVGFHSDELRAALAVGFVTGHAGGVLSNLLEASVRPETSWEPACYVKDLFLAEFIDACLVPKSRPAPARRRAGKLLQTMLRVPAADAETVELRQRVFSELRDRPGFETEAKDLLDKLVHLESQFDAEGNVQRFDSTRRRIEVLGEIRAAISLMARAFPGASSALARVSEYGCRACETPGFRALTDLLTLDEELSVVDLRLRLRADGHVRELSVLQIQERKGNPFYASPWRRFWQRIRFFFLGYRFSDQELVKRWLDLIYEGIEPLLVGLFRVRSDLEFYAAGLHFKEFCAVHGLGTCLPEFLEGSAGPDLRRELIRFFNPLLFVQGVVPIPCDLSRERAAATTIVTGPNSGGKTRLLQGIALAQLLAQAGFVFPAESARLRQASGMFVSLYEESSAGQAEGRLGTELIRIRRLFERLLPNSLVILDELCSGTNPSEGEEIFQLVLSLLPELAPETYVTTHFLEFAERLSKEKLELSFLQVELDPKERPTFAFVPGVASTSLARQTAARLGVTREELGELIQRRRRG